MTDRPRRISIALPRPLWILLAAVLALTAGVAYLKGMTSLRVLRLRRTRVSDEATADLKHSLPNAEIRRWLDLD